jgi:amino acid transporter
MKKTIKQLTILICLVSVLALPYFVMASAPLEKLKEVQTVSGYAEANGTTLSTTLGKIVGAFLGLLGVIFIMLMIYSGYNWMTAAGEEAKIEKAKDTIKSAIIGIVLVTGSYAIWSFVLRKIILGWD